jgi:hypothetical protein
MRPWKGNPVRAIDREWALYKSGKKHQIEVAQKDLETRIADTLIGLEWDPADPEGSREVRDRTIRAILDFTRDYPDRFAAGVLYCYLCMDGLDGDKIVEAVGDNLGKDLH